ncbi:ankyrin repeat domain-containing protein, partial [Brachyspira pulli]
MKIIIALLMITTFLYSNTINESNNKKIKNTSITNEIIMPSEELLKLLEKNKKKTGVAEIIELINK